MDHGAPISYLVLAEGTPVLSSDGERVGEVKRVLADGEAAIFDGVIVDTPDGDRFVDAPHAGDLYEQAMVLSLDAEQARDLPDPDANPAVVDIVADDMDEGSDLRQTLRRAWDRISGNY